MERLWPRDWCDVVFGHRGATYRRTLGALQARGIIVIDSEGRTRGGVRLTAYGRDVQESLR